jgi:3-phenylpropionate/cinnamic acid dioxygenase small subunit
MTSSISSDRAIANLIARYSFLVDDGDFDGLGELLDGCAFSLGSGAPVTGKKAIAQFARQSLMLYDDGTPRTRHVTSNLFIEVDETTDSAHAQSYYTVFQSLTDFPLQPIACGTYQDRFERRHGIWMFKERSVQTRFAGDTSRHRRKLPP